ncbi:hypothetical protein VPH49_18840 [Pseudomonas luteola]|uniref:PD-(D/E)XK nuclease domain-containing protein n=1 Tax=Pseudomonas luteola TaxID=47886 RepID=UPI003A871F6D
MEYLSESRSYFQKFRKAHLSEYFDVMKYYNVGGNSGYQYFYRCHEVIQTIRDIYHNLEEFYHDTSIPEGFATPRALVESWVNFHNMLTSREEVFSEIKSHIVEERKKTAFYDEEENVYDFLPEPLVRINAVRLEVIELLSHLLEMDDVKAFINPGREATEVAETRSTVEIICRNFHRYCLQMLRRHNNRDSIAVSDEYDVQDLMHSIFRLHFDDVRAEEYTPSYAGGASRIDFLLAQENIAVEVKKTRETLRDKQVGEQLLVDIGRYSSHPKVKRLICFVYDPEHFVTNPSGIESDLSKETNGIDVLVIVTPQGN